MHDINDIIDYIRKRNPILKQFPLSTVKNGCIFFFSDGNAYMGTRRLMHSLTRIMDLLTTKDLFTKDTILVSFFFLCQHVVRRKFQKKKSCSNELQRGFSGNKPFAVQVSNRNSVQ